MQVLALQNEPGIQGFFSTYRYVLYLMNGGCLPVCSAVCQTIWANCRHKQLLLEELVSLSSEEVYTILCLPAMSQEHVLNAPMAEGKIL